jgi:hypothetical protein
MLEYIYYSLFASVFLSFGYILGSTMFQSKDNRTVKNRLATLELLLKDMIHWNRDHWDSTSLQLEKIQDYIRAKPHSINEVVQQKVKRGPGRPRKKK